MRRKTHFALVIIYIHFVICKNNQKRKVKENIDQIKAKILQFI